MLYKLRMEYALAALGFDARRINPNYRQAASQIGSRIHSYPREAALMLVAQLPYSELAPFRREVLLNWARSGKIRIERADVSEALMALNCYGDVVAQAKPEKQG